VVVGLPGDDVIGGGVVIVRNRWNVERERVGEK